MRSRDVDMTKGGGRLGDHQGHGDGDVWCACGYAHLRMLCAASAAQPRQCVRYRHESAPAGTGRQHDAGRSVLPQLAAYLAALHELIISL